MVLKNTSLKLLIQRLDAASEVVCILVFDIKAHDINLLIRRISATNYHISILIVIVIVFDIDRLRGFAFLYWRGGYGWF